MFRGVSEISIDDKGRIAIPSRFRERLAGIAAGCLVQTVGLWDRSVLLFPLPEWESVEIKLDSLPDANLESRRIKQMVRGYATDCQIDSQGRILIPAELREYAQLDRQCVILGQGNKFEIWDRQQWTEKRDAWVDSVADEAGKPSEALQSLSL